MIAAKACAAGQVRFDCNPPCLYHQTGSLGEEVDSGGLGQMRKEVRRELASQSRISAVLSQAEAEARLRAACGQSTVRLEPGWLRRCVGDGEAPAVTPSHRDLPLVCGGQLGLPFYLTCPHPCVLPCPPSRRPVCNVRKPSWTARRQAARAEPMNQCR